MSIAMVNKVRNIRVGSPIAKSILLYLADCHNPGDGCFPSQNDIATVLELSPNSVRRYIGFLENGGFVTREFQQNNGKIERTYYTINTTPQAGINTTPQVATPQVVTTPQAQVSHPTDGTYIKEFLNSNNNGNKKDTLPDFIEEIFGFWCDTFNLRSTAQLTSKRKTLIKARVKEYSMERIKNAILGCSVTPWNCGDNPDRKKYHDLTLICRDGSNIERFESTWLSRPEKKVNPHYTPEMRKAMTDLIDSVHKNGR